jgi:hypothetical protein
MPTLVEQPEKPGGFPNNRLTLGWLNGIVDTVEPMIRTLDRQKLLRGPGAQRSVTATR